MRLKIIRIVIGGFFLMITIRLFYLQVIQGQHLLRLSVNNRIRVVPLEGWRGQIKDRNGKILADNRLSYDVMITPQEIQGGEAVFVFLSQILGTDRHTLVQIYNRKKVAAFAPVAIAEDIPKEKAIMIEENRDRFPSLFIQENYRRFYPLRENSAHVLGYIGKMSLAKREQFQEYGYSMHSVVGYSGVEEFYDDELRGGEGGLQVEVNSRAQQVRLLGFREPKKGKDITLTIDSEIQRDALELLADRIGTVIVMDMDNGEVLGLINSPAFDPNVFVGNRDSQEINRLFADPDAPLLNRAIKGLFPPGSIFKVVMAIAGLDTQKITVDTTFFCDGSYRLRQSIFRCAHTHGLQNLIEGLTHSCNVYFYNLGMFLGVDTISHYARLVGLIEKTGIDLPYEQRGIVLGREERRLKGAGGWHAGDTLNLSIGQGQTQVTPLQMVRLLAMVAHDGRVPQPHMIKAIGNTPVEKFSSPHKIKIAETVFATIRQGLRAAVADPSGTAHVVDFSDIFVAGKTGTAQTSGGKKTHAWFVGYAKGKNRNVAFCVLLEHGGSSYNACVLTRELLLRMKEKKIL